MDAITEAQARLARLEGEATELRVTRQSVDDKLAANEQEQTELRAFLKWANTLGISKPTLAVEVTTDVAARSVASKLAAQSRRPYGTMIAAVQLCVEILRETNKPWRTRELVGEMARRGLSVGGADPVTNLSNRLGRSNLLRSHRVLGWHLAEWPDFPDPTQERIAILRTQVQDEIGRQRENPEPVSFDEAKGRAFYGMGVPEAAISVISANGRPMGNVEIAATLQEAGFPFGGKDFPGQIETTLRRRMKSNFEPSRVVVRVAPGTWGLVKWYSREQIEEFSKSLGGMPGRDFNSHREKTQAGIEAAKARGMRLGRAPKFSEEQMEIAKRMMVDGASTKEVAAAFNVTSPCVLKWQAKWLKAAKT